MHNITIRPSSKSPGSFGAFLIIGENRAKELFTGTRKEATAFMVGYLEQKLELERKEKEEPENES